ncbi:MULTISPECIES: acireductone synthase [Rhodanobacteraceae]|uniref:acireductone synthase n=1 Tax=Rhodanobacteraceae TaxID=1775411 RepID=UPI00087FF996|nr:MULTISPECIES: acireductone synthase [Rhodanobacteraceae]SDF46274.1 acireductone synthase [Dyella sp. 333MFSha]SKB26323.1 acireductone synthase [Luteibacter sp. 22Crub2.1]
MSDIRAVLTDIEGTTSSIDFVKDVLFPYARQHLPAYVETHTDEPEVQHWLHEAAKEAGIVEATRGEIIDLLIRWIDEDRKSTALKALQGMIWREGYESGVYTSHMYPEVAARLRAWHQQGLSLYVYSSGSVPAQKLLFGFTENGDLTPLFSGYFDTQTGHKRDTESYRKIAEAIGLEPAQVLFLSDIREELDAARDAGMRTTHLIRPPLPLVDAGHPAVTDFDAIIP